MFLSEKEKKYFFDWYFRAKLDENFDHDRQFFYYYALFDHLFKSYFEEHKEILEKQGLSLQNGERNKMAFFIYNILFNEPEKKFFNSFNPFATLNTLNLNKITNKVQQKFPDLNITDYHLPPYEVIIKLFSIIYEERCNLFHGDFDLSNSEHIKLIEECNYVLDDFLKRLFESNID